MLKRHVKLKLTSELHVSCSPSNTTSLNWTPQAMDPVSALGLACSVMQVISFGLETISLCKQIYTDGHPDLSLAESGHHLEALGASITQQLNKCSQPLTARDMAFLKVAEQCARDAGALRAEVAYLAPKKAHELQATISATLRSLRHGRKLERLQGNLSKSQELLNTSMLESLCDRSQALAIQSSNGFASLDHSLQHFIRQYADGQIIVAEIIQSSSQALKVHVTDESTTTRREITAHISDNLADHRRGIENKIVSSTAKASENVSDKLEKQHNFELAAQEHRRKLDGIYNQRKRLVESLKWPDANARYNRLPDACPGTFDWVFDPAASSPHDRLITMHWRGLSVLQPDDSDYLQSALLTWLKSGENLFWISGKPGSGKSTFTKFIVGHPQTKKALNEWDDSTIIMSHFFWLPGSEMQKSISGMLCSLLHQALLYQSSTWDPDTNNLPHEDTLLSQFPQLSEKSSTSDWSVAELKQVLYSHLNSSMRYYCIFLDGLDEILPNDGPHSLLQILDELTLLSSVKLCVSSRPELIFENHFSQGPSLKMQDLTAPDIRNFAFAFFNTHTKLSTVQADQIIDRILYMADGVFLWAALMIESFKRGLSNGDTWNELHQRLETAPTDLMDLYRDMWSRLNDDKIIYRKTAALYISLLIKSKITACPLFDLRPHWPKFTVIDLMAASSSQAELHDLLELRPELPSSIIEENCLKTIRNLSVRCAGLLTIFNGNPFWVNSDMEGLHNTSSSSKSPSSTVIKYTNIGIDFTHRSAYDFLVDTKDGRSIWSDCDLSEFELLCQLIKGAVLRHRILKGPGGDKWAELKSDKHELIPELCTWLFDVTSTMPPAELEALLSMLTEFSINGDFTPPFNCKRMNVTRFNRPEEFLALLFPRFDTFVEAFIASYSERLTAENVWYILVDICCSSGVLNQDPPATSPSFPATIRTLLQRIEWYTESRDEDTSEFINEYAPVAHCELLCGMLKTWPLGQHRDIILDIITKLRIGCDSDRPLYMGVECTIDGLLKGELEIWDVPYHHDKTAVLQPLRQWQQWISSKTEPTSERQRVWTTRIFVWTAFFNFTRECKRDMRRIILEVNLSFAIDCVLWRHFGPEVRTSAHFVHQGSPKCRVVWTNNLSVGPEAAKHDDFLKLKDILCFGLMGDPSFPADQVPSSYDWSHTIWGRQPTTWTESEYFVFVWTNRNGEASQPPQSLWGPTPGREISSIQVDVSSIKSKGEDEG